MPLPSPRFVMAHAVFQPPNPLQRDPARDNALIQALAEEFPNQVAHQLLPPEVPVTVPHLTLASSSAQLAVSAAQLDFEVRFYGDYLSDIERGLEYVERKMLAVVRAMNAVGASVAMVGLIGTLQFSFRESEGLDPALHILETNLRTQVDRDAVQDALARIAVRVRETYFVTMTLSNYESRILERPLMPGLTQIRLRPWEGRVEDTGLELTLDINNNLEARTRNEDPVVTEGGIQAVTRLLRDIATTTGPHFAETGELSVEALTESSL